MEEQKPARIISLKEVAVSSPSPTRRESKDVFLPSS
jgi:hypothetical protein